MDAINIALSGSRRADDAGIYIEYLLTVYVYASSNDQFIPLGVLDRP